MQSGHPQWLAFQNDMVDQRDKQTVLVHAFHTDVAKCTLDSTMLRRGAGAHLRQSTSVESMCRFFFRHLYVRVPQHLPQVSSAYPRSWDMLAAFSSILEGFLQSQHWVVDEYGMSSLELYVMFVHLTGWRLRISWCKTAFGLKFLQEPLGPGR